MRTISVWTALATLVTATTAATAAITGVTIEDYFKVRRVTELALSPDGGTVAYIATEGSLPSFDSNKLSPVERRKARTTYLLDTKKGATPAAVTELDDAFGLAWLPGARELAFVSPRAGVAQVYSYDVRSGEVRRHFGAPAELVIYPQTGHNPELPSIQRESARRNFEWFSYWLLGERPDAAEQAAQYARWDAMRAASKVGQGASGH